MESIIGILADTNESLHKRIRALFSLKPLGEQAIPHLIKVLVTETNILLSHEIAYVLGQMNSKLSLPTLTVLLENVCEINHYNNIHNNC